jgi:hypothetical protein
VIGVRKLSGNREFKPFSVKRAFKAAHTGNSYRGISWRLITTVSGDTG